jgi:hypothetical protein
MPTAGPKRVNYTYCRREEREARKGDIRPGEQDEISEIGREV